MVSILYSIMNQTEIKYKSKHQILPVTFKPIHEFRKQYDSVYIIFTQLWMLWVS